MATTASQKKNILGPERTAALAALSTAHRRHEHAGIRPKLTQLPAPSSEAVEVKRNAQLGRMFDRGLQTAADRWPDSNEWEIIGSDDTFESDGGGGDEGDDGTCFFGTPDICGEFLTNDDVPGWAG